jgi:N-acetyl-beta-hexosaminidase
MGLPEPTNLADVQDKRPVVRARAIESLRTALERPLSLALDARAHQASPDIQQSPDAVPDKKRDVAVAMGLAREAVATAARAAEDELRRMRELLDAAEVRARAAEERAELAEAHRAETEKLLADIRDQIVTRGTRRQAA